ncbi:MAG: hypothetical protein U5J95_04940 [Balneolaceae bacterium]|nr:hypothetical protein [Balneolaceae bacterium]
MQIISDFTKDVQNPKPQPGAYEWWYFDAIDNSGRYKIVIIFYEGNPFSPSYIKGIDSSPAATADEYPATSISIYDRDKPIYYSFTEFKTENCFFNGENPEVKIGKNLMRGFQKDEQIIYELRLEEVLPSGDSLKAELTFTSRVFSHALFSSEPHEEEGHFWNLVQPYSEVKGILKIGGGGSESISINFKGNGYHDHNTGSEPMKEEFVDWYWGRAHFKHYTLVYYLMNKKDSEQHKAWLIDHKAGSVAEVLDQIQLADESLTLFGLKSARKIGIKNERFEIVIQQSSLLDNGPFYQRFGCDVFLHDKKQEITETAVGISEYIYPERIHQRVFWPLVTMRIYSKKNGPHWVQKSKTLYRWTW